MRERFLWMTGRWRRSITAPPAARRHATRRTAGPTCARAARRAGKRRSRRAQGPWRPGPRPHSQATRRLLPIDMTGPEEGIRASLSEIRREIACRVCRGDIKRCRLAICPYLGGVRAWFEDRADLRSTNLFGASPPGSFVGSWGYPRVLAGPLVPPVRDEDASVLDASEGWLAYDLPQILRFRLSLVRGKAARRVAEARNPDPILSKVQEAAM